MQRPLTPFTQRIVTPYKTMVQYHNQEMTVIVIQSVNCIQNFTSFACTGGGVCVCVWSSLQFDHMCNSCDLHYCQGAEQFPLMPFYNHLNPTLHLSQPLVCSLSL